MTSVDIMIEKADHDEIWIPLKQDAPRKFRAHGIGKPRSYPSWLVPAPCAALVALRLWRDQGGQMPTLIKVWCRGGEPTLVQGIWWPDDDDDGGDDTEIFLYHVYRWNYAESAR